MCFIMLTAPAYADETDSAGAATLVDDNFDSYTSVEDMLNNNYKIPLGKPSCSIESESESESGNKFFRMSSKNDQIQADKYFTAVDDEKLEITVSFRNNNINFGKMLSVWQKDGGGNDFFYFLKIDAEGRICATNGNKTQDQFLMTAAADKWYTAKTVFDMKARKYTISVSDGEKTKTSQPTNFPNDKVTNINRLRFQSWPQSNGTIDFDDLCVKKTSQPTLPTSAVKVYNSVGTEVANWESIPTKCEIKLDFGTKMDASSLNIQTVKFVKKADNKSVAYSGSLSDSVYTITPSSLEPNTEYTVKVDKSVRNVSGVSMTEDIEISLKTANTEEQPDAVWISDDFNSYTEIDGVKEAYTVTDETGVTLSLDDDNNDKSLKLSGAATSSDGIKIDKYFEETDDGKLEVSVRFKKNSTNFGTSMRVFQKSTGEWFYFFVIGSDGNAKAVYAPNGNYGNNPIQSLMQVVADKWYTAKAVFDMNARTYTVSVSDGTTEKTGTPINFSSAKVKEIDRVGIQSWLKNNGTINFDDLNVKLFDAQFALKLGGVKNGDDNKDITKLTELVAAGDKAKLSLKYLNAKKLTADANVCIITAYYKNGECVKVEPLNKQTLATTQPNGAITYDLHIEDISGVNCIKIFVWDGSDNMKPYCGCAKF